LQGEGTNSGSTEVLDLFTLNKHFRGHEISQLGCVEEINLLAVTLMVQLDMICKEKTKP